MDPIKSHLKAIEKMISLALSDAESFRGAGDAEKADQALVELLSRRRDGYMYAVATQLGSSANFHGRISFAQFIGGVAYSVNLTDCWEERVLAAKFRELDVFLAAKKAGTPAALFEQYSVQWQGSRISALAFDLWKLYVAGHEKHIKEMASFFELFDLRQDAASLNISAESIQPYNISVCVTLLIAREKADVAAVGKLLEVIPICKGITQFWEDDAKFAKFTERAAQWHLEYCPKHFSEFSEFANVASDVLVPSWILALDKFRQKHLGRPCSLSQHELLELGKSVLHAAQMQNHPRLPTLVVAEKHFIESFGTESFNPLPFWEKFLVP